jgi:hypothetical protein
LTRTRIWDSWEEIVTKLSLDLSKPMNHITAQQIKATIHKEPRILAKMDTAEDLPSIFRDRGLFLLPISRSQYLIVKGKGYHKLESITENPVIHETRFPFPSAAIGVSSEGVYLDYAHSSGLLGKVTGFQNLFLAFRGRRTTPRFSFNINAQEITVDRAQIEVDGSYEGHDGIVLVEAKIHVPNSFNIRQLYYPYRTLNERKLVRNLFFCFEPVQREYYFWEYQFKPSASFDSIHLLNARKFVISVVDAVTLKEYADIQPDRKTIPPQADSVDKIIEFPFRVSEGYDTSEKMTKAFGFVQRQSSYYRQAAELLGLVELYDNRYRLTELGEKYVKLLPEERNDCICRLLLEFPIMNEIFLRISIERNRKVTREEIISIIKKNSQLTGSTLPRRAQTIVSWFKWIRSNIGIVQVDEKGGVSASRQSGLH